MSNSRSRSFCFTWNNYPDEHQDRLDTLGFRYTCYGYEWAPATGTPHLQGYLYFENARTHRSIVRALPGVHVTIARGSFPDNRKYCSKDGEFVEFGDPPQCPKEIGEAEKERFLTAWELAKRGFLCSFNVRRH